MTSSNEWWCYNSPLFCHFLLLVNFFIIYLCQFDLLEVLLPKQEDILLLIEPECKLLHYNKVTSLCHWITLLYNNNIFHKNAFLNLNILLKDIFEKCWHQHSCVVKMNSLSYPLYNLITFCKLISHASWTILRENWKCLEKSLFFSTLAKNADVTKFPLAPRL